MKPYLNSFDRRELKYCRKLNKRCSTADWYEFTLALRNLGAEINKERASLYVMCIFIVVLMIGVALGQYGAIL